MTTEEPVLCENLLHDPISAPQSLAITPDVNLGRRLQRSTREKRTHFSVFEQ